MKTTFLGKKPGMGLAACALAAALALSVSCASRPESMVIGQGGSPAQAWAAFDRFAAAEMKALGVTGMAVSVSDSSGEIRSSGYGWADKAAKMPFTPDTISNAGSVSKLFTCAAILSLVEDGLVDLDAPIDAYLPEYAPPVRFPEARKPTVRDLLTHHSGLPSDYLQGFLVTEGLIEGYPHPYRGNAAKAATLKPASPPGTVFSYCNLGFGMLGEIVERASGMDFEDYCQQEILKPLKMETASFEFKDEFKDRYAKGYLGGKPFAIPSIRDMPAGSLNLSARDLGRFGAAVLAGVKGKDGFLKAATVDEMLTRQNEGVVLDADFSIGLTWWFLEAPQLPGERLAGHGGDLNAFHALHVMVPGRDISVSILVNSANGIGSFDLSGVAAEAVRAAIAQKGGEPPAPPRSIAPSAPLPAGAAAGFAGTWATPMGLMQIKPAGKKLAMRAFGQNVSGIYRTDGSLGVEARVLGIKLPIPMLDMMSLTAEEFGAEQGMYLRLMGFPFALARRVEAKEPGPAWASRLGEYEVVDPKNAYVIGGLKLEVDKGSGVFCAYLKQGSGWNAYPVAPISDDELAILGSGRNLGEVISWASANAGTISYNGIRFEKKRSR